MTGIGRHNSGRDGYWTADTQATIRTEAEAEAEAETETETKTETEIGTGSGKETGAKTMDE